MPKWREGKVRDLYRWGKELWLVATDRLSAFDVVLPTLIPGKGRILTAMSREWFCQLEDICPNHVISYELPPGWEVPEWEGRLLRARFCKVIPVECIVRGYLAGSAWEEYRQWGTAGGQELPKGLVEGSALPEPLFTPTTKASQGHDELLRPDEARAFLGEALFERLKTLSIQLYQAASEYARQRGILIADTKLEFGWYEKELVLIDEVFTPDSSRLWALEEYAPGKALPSLDKQVVRDFLKSVGWRKEGAPPALPEEVVVQTAQKYRFVLERLFPEAAARVFQEEKAG
ncbi:phosphoribosylaminoimidazolesuccinocarboxamide synthase [Candidatus Methylacidithermus pantelleriae]|uniref:phosphoribosylaminoimidazolesuccinocarboxamide synthase n=1 Tax=Candidatus Methylacidithermus pantelleriae TaxID=2744239 RepID=UPI001F405A72|nr:phosphoribosylaminoimidazolesuccinocarboxamide synthase [Candidatus Methylacidithermus pantelleriae]